MDNVHNLDKKQWILNKKLNIKELLELRQEQLRVNNVQLTTDLNSAQFDAEYVEQLENDLKEFVLESETEVKQFFMFSLTDERAIVKDDDCKLKMFQIQAEHARRMIFDRAYKVNYLSTLKMTRNELLMRHLASCDRIQTQPSTSDVTCDSVTNALTLKYSNSSSDVSVLIVVQLWPQPNKNEKVRLKGEILFRADQSLTDLRDQIKCQRDYGVPMDLSENPDQEIDRVYRCELFKSAFFLIEDTFFNDLRDPNNINLSAPIHIWATEEVTSIDQDGRNTKVSRGIGPFKQGRMEEVRFEDLQIRLGCPYLYVHQGDCEHLFTISDIIYLPNDTKLHHMQFPFITATSIGRKEDNLRCYMCRLRPPHWYTRNNDRLPVDPFFFCEHCFYSFNYDSDRKKIGAFQAYLYASAFAAPHTMPK